MFEVKVEDLAGRIGQLKTRSGVIETPYLFPVVDPLLRKQLVDLPTIKSIGFNAIITNAYLALRRYGSNVNLRDVLSFDGVIMTDSGAYQLMQYGDIDVSNVEIMEFQCRCGSDIGVPLDIPTRYEDPRPRVVYSVLETLARLREGARIAEECSKVLWVAPVQGGTQLDLLRLSAKRVVDEGLLRYYSIVAIGSPTTLLERFRFEKVVEMIGVVRSIIPSSIPVHLFGAGHPLIIPFAVALGVDLMDSASYIIYARDGRYMSPRGTYRIDELEYFPCSCPVCAKYSPKDLLEMSDSERVRLLAMHNLYVIRRELNRVKQAIKEGRLWEYLEEVSKRHPAARRAFEALMKFYQMILSRSPSSKGEVKSIMILGSDSIYNPRIVKARRKIERSRIISGEVSKVALIPLLHKWKPLSLHELARSLLDEGYLVIGYDPTLGAVPLHVSDAFPFSQFETCNNFDDSAIETASLVIQEYLERFCNSAKLIEIIACRDIPWSALMSSKLIDVVCQDRDVRKEIVEMLCGDPYGDG